MRLLLLTGLLILQFFTAPGSEAKAPVSHWKAVVKKEAQFSKTTNGPVAEDLHHGIKISTATQPRRYGPAGGLMEGTLVVSRSPLTTLPCSVQNKTSFCTPIALRLLFPRHYFW